MSLIAENLNKIRENINRIALKAGRAPEEITLIAVTKTVDSAKIIEAINSGVLDIGENRVQEAKMKFQKLPSLKITRHMIGHLQTNKVKDAVSLFDVIQSVDSFRLAGEIDKEAKKKNKIISCFVEVNSGSEISKFGFDFKEVLPFLSEVSGFQNIIFNGIMTVAPIVNDPETARPFFKKMRALFEDIKLKNIKNIAMKHMSMGMSQDYQVAIEEGATMVRVGTKIFGEREI